MAQKNAANRLTPVFWILVLIIIGSVLAWSMWKGSGARLMNVAGDSSLSDSAALEKIAKVVWPEHIKKASAEKIPSGEYELEATISYGSIMALGDIEKEKLRRTDELARGALLCFRAGKERKLTKLILQLETPVKSAFGNKTERIIAYRTILYLQDVEKIPQWETCSINEDAKQKIRSLWYVKLDKFNELRVE
ncbi:MAG: hypothetical protein JW728_01250 [Candidatus Aureabacteria bacterium]|nr:hypothetical protein [Candidatus Auribacterota bacterium]